MRGERSCKVVIQVSATGSSPRARGTRLLVSPPVAGTRFIPACAGNARTARIVSWRRSVHPRVRGERPKVRASPRNTPGSSPRARGTRMSRPCRCRESRFIPACAGNATERAMSKQVAEVHPRVRGEREWVEVAGVTGVGSSPRARGTLRTYDGTNVVNRFIPACAGNARRRPGRTGHALVHPRVRGERAARDVSSTTGYGSSPRARGTRDPPAVGKHPARFIPACAGNAVLGVEPALHEPVHPRVRGERLFELSLKKLFGGSSPRARGTHGGAPLPREP